MEMWQTILITLYTILLFLNLGADTEYKIITFSVTKISTFIAFLYPKYYFLNNIVPNSISLNNFKNKFHFLIN